MADGASEPQSCKGRAAQPVPRGRSAAPQISKARLPFVSLLLLEEHSLTFVAEQAGHSVAGLAKHYAGVPDELEDLPHTPAAEAINAARKELTCAQSVRIEGSDHNTPPAGSPANHGVGDTGLEPVTSALSRRRSPS